MLKKIFSMILILLPINIYAQYINYSPFNYYTEISPTEKYQTYGVGDYGFDSKINYFNPNYFSQKKEFYINIFGIINVASHKGYNINFGYPVIVNNKIHFLPNISIGFKTGDYLINLIYINDFQFDSKVSATPNNSELRFYTSNGVYSIYPSNLNLEITNNILQLSLARKLGDNFSIAAGVITNSFSYNLDFDNSTALSIFSSHYSFNLNSGFFSNLQFLTSLDYINPDGVSFYLVFKSQGYHNKLNPSTLFMNDSIGIKNSSEINLPGHLAYGIQFHIINRLKMSIEMLNEFVAPKSNTFDTKFSLGFNYLLLNSLHLGMIGGVYIHKAYATNMFPDGAINNYMYSPKQAQNPFEIIISAGYEIHNMNFNAGYQYTNASYKAYGGTIINESGILYFGVGYNL